MMCSSLMKSIFLTFFLVFNEDLLRSRNGRDVVESKPRAGLVPVVTSHPWTRWSSWSRDLEYPRSRPNRRPRHRARCLAKSHSWIPKLLERLSQKRHDVGLRHLLYSFVALYLTFGHRAGVMTNLTTEEVREAARGSSCASPGVVLNVKNHKTARAFGCAQVFLTHEEFGWIQHWMEIHARLRPRCNLVFNTNDQPISNITTFARNAWAAMLLPGRPSITDVRTAVATMSRNTQSSEVRMQMSRVMCHDTHTAD
ncbi:uncharacterized protein LOC111611201 isoform X1 [Xiphophorus maculatus]|uniref:uncharacterized protein LOC111611201 isoform X1 n=1 Tax=Xiphophorus maculatus TaxID=8083 RepID=UPI000C6E1097|nr:uncharacterized protein LOC111611201 isoform X1 [Xiphophorus maculatus]